MYSRAPRDASFVPKVRGVHPDLGPTSHQSIQTTPTLTKSFAPFSSLANRTLDLVSPISRTLPAPGEYDATSDAVISHEPNALWSRSAAPRFPTESEGPVNSGRYVPVSTAKDVHLDLRTQKEREIAAQRPDTTIKTSSRFLTISEDQNGMAKIDYQRGKTIPTIPTGHFALGYVEGKNGRLQPAVGAEPQALNGPGYYDPQFPRSRQIVTSFKNRSGRDDSTFVSSLSAVIPSPTAYTLPSSFDPKQPIAPYFAKVRSSIRPIANKDLGDRSSSSSSLEDHAMAGPATYALKGDFDELSERLKRRQQHRERLMMDKAKKGISLEEKELDRSSYAKIGEALYTPPPGAYEVAKSSTMDVGSNAKVAPFGSQSSRFARPLTSVAPEPGRYQTVETTARPCTQHTREPFSSGKERFEDVQARLAKQGGPTPGPGAYTNMSVPAVVYKTPENRGFGVASRFAKLETSTPGIGAYDVADSETLRQLRGHGALKTSLVPEQSAKAVLGGSERRNVFSVTSNTPAPTQYDVTAALKPRLTFTKTSNSPRIHKERVIETPGFIYDIRSDLNTKTHNVTIDAKRNKRRGSALSINTTATGRDGAYGFGVSVKGL